jgi:hypothetical protein
MRPADSREEITSACSPSNPCRIAPVTHRNRCKLMTRRREREVSVHSLLWFSKGKEGNALDTDVDGALTSGPRGERKGEGKSAVVLGAVPSNAKR